MIQNKFCILLLTFCTVIKGIAEPWPYNVFDDNFLFYFLFQSSISKNCGHEKFMYQKSYKNGLCLVRYFTNTESG